MPARLPRSLVLAALMTVVHACDCGTTLRSSGAELRLCVLRPTGAVDPALCSDLGTSPAVVPVVDFATVPAGTTARRSVTLFSEGGAALEIASAILLPGGASTFALEDAPASHTIDSGDALTFQVIFSPVSGGRQETTIELRTNDPRAPVLEVAVRADVRTGTTQELCGASICADGEQCCGGTCIDPTSDRDHCGGCDPCPGGNVCSEGRCLRPASAGCDELTAPCSNGLRCCNHQCLDVSARGGLCPCASDGTTSFGAGSLVIPMDVCWQRGSDVSRTPSYCTRNAKTSSDDAPLKAYGLVFFLIRHQVTVYVAIDPAKMAIDAVDLSFAASDGRAPVERYDWTAGRTRPLTDDRQTSVEYRGAPFLIDASQHDRVMQLLASDPDFAPFREAGTITMHVARTPFSAAIARSITTVPSRIALLAPTGDSGPYQILLRYLESAGLNFPGAGGTPSSPGLIYDQLEEADFLPNYASSRLKRGGYKLLWAPHWSGSSRNLATQLATIGEYVAAGGDLFAECAAITTLEGGSGQAGSAATRFVTTQGIVDNTASTGASAAYRFDGLASPFAQRGDFPFAGFSGAVRDFHPDPSRRSSYQPGVVRYVSTTNPQGEQTELFASIDMKRSGKGTVVYLAGHDYSYTGADSNRAGTTAGSRLVLNTIFGLGNNNVCAP